MGWQKTGLVIGMGMSGYAAARFLCQQGWQVAAYDDQFHLHSHHLSHEIMQLCERYGLRIITQEQALNMHYYNLVVVSPGIAQTHPLYQAALRSGVELIGEAELAMRNLPVHQRIWAITGTNGKTTVTRFVEHLLQIAGHSASAVGNVGKAIIDYAHSHFQTGILVTELSSYQLETMRTPAIERGIILNIMPNHLDRYAGHMEDYAAAKCQLQHCLKETGLLYVEERVLQNYQHLLQSANCRSFGLSPQADVHFERHMIIDQGKVACTLPEEVMLRPRYELLNLLAAYCLSADMGFSSEIWAQAIATFKKPAHRLEFVREHQGIRYYNDSKATTVAAVIEAVNALSEPIYLIAGGVEKGASYTDWIVAFQGKVKQIYAIGQAAPTLERELGAHISVLICPDLAAAVYAATKNAQQAGTVLLSPGGASFDQFRDYAHRGEVFKELVHALGENESLSYH